MAADLIRYDLLVQDAIRGVVRRVLTDAVRDGLPGEHHFYITFKTKAPGVRLSPRMREQYPDEMTIVLQHQFWDLAVTDQSFEVGLSFQGKGESLQIPFDALTGFSDPTVPFSFKFEFEPDAEEANANEADAPLDAGPAAAAPSTAVLPARTPAAKPAAKPAKSKDESEPQDGTKIVSIDAFRKKT